MKDPQYRVKYIEPLSCARSSAVLVGGACGLITIVIVILMVVLYVTVFNSYQPDFVGEILPPILTVLGIGLVAPAVIGFIVFYLVAIIYNATSDRIGWLSIRLRNEKICTK